MKEEYPKAIRDGSIKIGENEIRCAVLEDGTRVLSRIDLLRTIGRRGKAKGGRAYDQESKMPVFLTANNLKPYINIDLRENSSPIYYKPIKGGKYSIGYKAEILPLICNVFIEADEANVILPVQKHIVEECKILIRGFAVVGINALIDEATGYQEIRDREALQAILDKYITDEWAKWTKTFPDEFYKELFRLKGIHYPPISMKKPSYVGHWTNDIVYSRLAPGVLKALKEKNPRMPMGHRQRKHHQYLTRDIGHPALREHLSNVIFLMRGCARWNDFKRMLERAKPKEGDTLRLDFPEEKD